MEQRERRLARAQQLASMGSWELELYTNMILLSDEACRIYGLPPGQNRFSFDKWLSFPHPDDLDFVINKIADSRESLIDCSFNYRIIQLNGATRHIYAECKFEPDADGRPQIMHGITQDITEAKLAEEQTEFERNNLDALINNTSDLMWSVDTDFKLITSNQPFNDITRSMSGHSIAKGSNILSPGFSTEQLKRYKIIYERVFTGESFTETEFTEQPFEFWSEISYSPIRKGNEVIGAACHSRDITERKKAEESNSFKANLLNTIGQSVIATDMQGIISFWNNAAKEIYGWSAREAIGKDITDLIPTQQTKEEEIEIMTELRQGRTWAGDFIVQGKNGKAFPAFATGTPIYDQQHLLTGIIAVSSDITRRKAIEERMASDRSGLRQAQAIAQVGSWEIDMIHNSHYWSDEVYKIFGINKGDVIASEEAFMAFFHPDDLAHSYKLIDEGFKTFQNISFDFRFIRKDGMVRFGYNEWKFKFDKDGNPEWLFGIIQDVTDRKQAETERLKMVNDLLIRNKELEQFAYIVSHNLRAPVANILGASYILNDPALSVEKRALLGKGLTESVTRLDDVIKDLNQVLQVKRTVNEIKETVYFSQLVNDIKISIKNLIERDNVFVKFDFSEMDELLTFKSYLYSIFYNLISNSIKYCQPQLPCMIEIKSNLSGKKLWLTFKDNGMGIDLEKRGDQVFGLYKRFHTGVEGKGMGLFMVKTQVETLGGKISIQSEVNKGTEFKIEFEI